MLIKTLCEHSCSPTDLQSEMRCGGAEEGQRGKKLMVEADISEQDAVGGMLEVSREENVRGFRADWCPHVWAHWGRAQGWCGKVSGGRK